MVGALLSNICALLDSLLQQGVPLKFIGGLLFSCGGGLSYFAVQGLFSLCTVSRGLLSSCGGGRLSLVVMSEGTPLIAMSRGSSVVVAGDSSLVAVWGLFSSCCALVGYNLVAVCGCLSSCGGVLFSSCDVLGDSSLIVMCMGVPL